MAETKNHLGLDKFQVTVIKSNYNSTKPIRKMIEKAEAKTQAAFDKCQDTIKAAQDKYHETCDGLLAEIQTYKDQIAMLDKFALETTKNACGLELTTEQVIEFLDNPTAFAAYKQEKQGVDMFAGQAEPRDLDAEEDKDWENRIQSGEIKQAI
jgi:prophage DNA circulation protein